MDKIVMTEPSGYQFCAACYSESIARLAAILPPGLGTAVVRASERHLARHAHDRPPLASHDRHAGARIAA